MNDIEYCWAHIVNLNTKERFKLELVIIGSTDAVRLLHKELQLYHLERTDAKIYQLYFKNEYDEIVVMVQKRIKTGIQQVLFNHFKKRLQDTVNKEGLILDYLVPHSIIGTNYKLIEFESAPTCYGCRNGLMGVRNHMEFGGCQYLSD